MYAITQDILWGNHQVYLFFWTKDYKNLGQVHTKFFFRITTIALDKVYLLPRWSSFMFLKELESVRKLQLTTQLKFTFCANRKDFYSFLFLYFFI